MPLSLFRNQEYGSFTCIIINHILTVWFLFFNQDIDRLDSLVYSYPYRNNEALDKAIAKSTLYSYPSRDGEVLAWQTGETAEDTARIKSAFM